VPRLTGKAPNPHDTTLYPSGGTRLDKTVRQNLKGTGRLHTCYDPLRPLPSCPPSLAAIVIFWEVLINESDPIAQGSCDEFTQALRTGGTFTTINKNIKHPIGDVRNTNLLDNCLNRGVALKDPKQIAEPEYRTKSGRTLLPQLLNG